MKLPHTMKMDRTRAFFRTVSTLIPPADGVCFLTQVAHVIMVTTTGNIPRRGSLAVLAVMEPLPGSEHPRARVAWLGKWPDYTNGVTDGLRQLWADPSKPRFSVERAAPFANIAAWNAKESLRRYNHLEMETRAIGGTLNVEVWATIREWGLEATRRDHARNRSPL